MKSARTWAEAEFGHAELGDERRTRRLVRLAAEVTSHPAGTVTKACTSSASREGAFRLLENHAVRPEAIQLATHQATARRCATARTVIVAVDATSLTVTDETETKGLGAVGAWSKGARGVHAMSALALSAEGTTLGICGQKLWAREAPSVHASRRRARGESEMRHWLDVLCASHAALADAAPLCTPWFQLDRGADCWQVLMFAHRFDLLVTVRAAHDRCVDAATGRLWATIEDGPVVATQRIVVSARPEATRNKRVGGKRRRIKVTTPPREARVATVQLRAGPAPLVFTTPQGRVLTATLNAVHVKEIGNAKEPLEWMLLTTHPVRTRADVREVVRAYALRWRVEEFHRAWKRGLCRVEETQLRSRDAIFKWATILAAVATRAMRLTHLARSTPDAPATSEFTSTELEALITLREPKGVTLDAIPTLALAVRWLADLGGYTGPWNGPPGATVIGRGLHDVLIAARAFENRDKKR